MAHPLLTGGESHEIPTGEKYGKAPRGAGIAGISANCAFDVQCTNIALTTRYLYGMKTSNLTVRIDPELKRHAQEAARILDVSLSQVISASLRGVVRQSLAYKAWLGEYVMPAPIQEAEQLGEDYAMKAGRERVLERIAVLQDKDSRNMLNKVTRLELKELLRRQLNW